MVMVVEVMVMVVMVVVEAGDSAGTEDVCPIIQFVISLSLIHI